MDVDHDDEDLDRLETDHAFTAGWPDHIVKAYRRRLQQIRAAVDERDLYALRSLNCEKLKGDRAGQHSVRLNDQWRLILQFQGKHPEKRVVVIEITDYH